MNLRLWTRTLVPLVAAAILVAGCTKSEDKTGKAKNTTDKDKGGLVDNKDKKDPKDKDTKHDGWWCDEHGIPEGECSKCSSKVAKAFKDKGDWCKEHKIAMSQCFICNPKQREVYAQKYRDKFGKEPPEPEDNMAKKDDKKDDKKDK
ncbi:MAG: hypothetical protein K2R98_13545 [Gemmataceae bacterium]|nr:hypothetical protein [Gemmataceae bacterium]